MRNTYLPESAGQAASDIICVSVFVVRKRSQLAHKACIGSTYEREHVLYIGTHWAYRSFVSPRHHAIHAHKAFSPNSPREASISTTALPALLSQHHLATSTRLSQSFYVCAPRVLRQQFRLSCPAPHMAFRITAVSAVSAVGSGGIRVFGMLAAVGR